MQQGNFIAALACGQEYLQMRIIKRERIETPNLLQPEDIVIEDSQGL